MEYRSLPGLLAEYLIRFHAQSFIYGVMVGSRALADPGPGPPDDKVSRAMLALFAGEFDGSVIEAHPTPPALDAPPADPARRKPGRPPKAAGDTGPNPTGRPTP